MNGLDLYTVNIVYVRLRALSNASFQSSVVGKDRYGLYRQLRDGIVRRQNSR